MKWLKRLLSVGEEPTKPVIEDGIERADESVLAKLGDGKHVIHIMLQEKEITLAFSDEEFQNGILRGQQLTKIPREE
jgi:hypothetical protein